MDLSGIEPLSAGCKPAALPLSYRPFAVVAIEASFRLLGKVSILDAEVKEATNGKYQEGLQETKGDHETDNH